MKSTCLCVILVLIITGFSYAALIHVPGDQPTIQAGIDAAVDGDTVLVADGTYTGDGNRDIDFNGKAITVKSENGAENCIIDCEENGRGFHFHSGETETSVVDGFTIQNGSADDGGGGICCYESSPIIANNIIRWNSAYEVGGGIYCDSSSPIIKGNIIVSNYAEGVWVRGGGIYCDSDVSLVKLVERDKHTLIDSGVFTNGSITFYFTLEITPDQPETFYISLDIAPDAPVGNSIGVKMAGNSYITVEPIDEVSTAGFPIESGIAVIKTGAGDGNATALAAQKLTKRAISTALALQGREDDGIPITTQVLPNYPNPFNPETWIPYKLAVDAPVTITIYNPKGQLIRTIGLGLKKAGVYVMKDKAAYWDGRNSFGQKVSSGVYYYSLRAGEFRAMRKMVIVK